MKTSIQNSLNILFTWILFSGFAYTQNIQSTVSSIQKSSSEDRVCTLIDVKGSRFADRIWIFTIPQCTNGFDNGWDGFKMFGSALAPQLFSIEDAGNFQVNSIPDINNTYLGFQAGEDTIYTFTFTNYFVDTRYQEMYLVDLDANKTIEIMQTGTQYTFVAKKTDSPEKRFKIISTDIPQVIVPENNISTIINVNGSRFSDQLSLITDSASSANFDKGKDTYKTFGSPLSPQIYAMESDGNYQTNVLNDINNTEIGFLPGEDTNYTLKFSNYNLDPRYKELYLIDLLENKTINILATGTEYSFTAEQTNTPVTRFKLVTSIPIPVVNPENQNQTESSDLNKTLTIFNSGKIIVIDNPTDNSGSIVLYDAQSGRTVSNYNFSGNGITTIQTNIQDGVYVLKAVTQTKTITKRIILR